MPEDTRVQQQVHMHIWMEADIIMVIVSEPPQGCQGEARFAWMQILDIKNQKIHHWRTRGFRQGGVEPRNPFENVPSSVTVGSIDLHWSYATEVRIFLSAPAVANGVV
jgi:hypothetical protein